LYIYDDNVSRTGSKRSKAMCERIEGSKRTRRMRAKEGEKGGVLQGPGVVFGQ
jgi:hypothetical protein